MIFNIVYCEYVLSVKPSSRTSLWQRTAFGKQPYINIYVASKPGLPKLKIPNFK